MANKHKKKDLNLFTVMNEILETRTYTDIAHKLNVTVETVKRWYKLKSVPKQYIFEIMRLANIKIDYSQFTSKEKDQFFIIIILKNWDI